MCGGRRGSGYTWCMVGAARIVALVPLLTVVAACGSSTSTATEPIGAGLRGAGPVKVVGGLDAPLGLVWVGDRLVVSSLGRVTAYAGFDGRRFRSSTVILGGPVAGGENNNVVLGPDGRLVMGVSASCDHCVPTNRWSATIVSFRPD